MVGAKDWMAVGHVVTLPLLITVCWPEHLCPSIYASPQLWTTVNFDLGDHSGTTSPTWICSWNRLNTAATPKSGHSFVLLSCTENRSSENRHPCRDFVLWIFVLFSLYTPSAQYSSLLLPLLKNAKKGESGAVCPSYFLQSTAHHQNVPQKSHRQSLKLKPLIKHFHFKPQRLQKKILPVKTLFM